MDKKKIKITYAPGAFADFDGTQEELDEFVQKIEEMLTDEGFLENLGKYDELQIEGVELNLDDEEDTDSPNQSTRLH